MEFDLLQSWRERKILMASRDPLSLMFARETPETIRAALEALQTIEPAGPQHAARILAIRDELLQELEIVEGHPLQARLL